MSHPEALADDGRQWSLDEFLVWQRTQDRRYELVNGRRG